MGRAARWLRGLLGEKKSVEGSLPPENRPAKEKKRWGFVKSFRESEKVQQLSGKGSDREERGNYERDADEQSMRAIAAATEKAAVAVVQAAFNVVRITSCSGRSVGFGVAVGMKLEECAAIKIQAVFRGYLARRALRALRGLVKLQALVRGNIVRKQAAETLRCMQALLRVQSRARAIRSESSRCRAGRSNPGPEKYDPVIQSSRSTKRNLSKQTRMDAIYENGDRFSDWNLLDQWMVERYGDSREVSKGFDDEKNAKILEVDTGKPPRLILRQSLAAMPDSPSKDSTAAKLSIPTSSSAICMAGRSPSPLGFPIVRPDDFLSSPQLFSATSDPGGLRRGAFTPAKRDCSRSVFGGCSDYRNYMANTESSRAKARSQSAPRQRPEYKKSSSMKSLSDHGFSGQLLPPPEAACSGWRSALHFQFAKKKYPGSGRLDRLGMP